LLAHYDAHIREDGEVLLVLSDHGFEDKKRPALTKVSDDRFAKMRYWHRRYGILIAHGPGVRRGAWVTSATIFDVAPTVLALFRLPLAVDMSGKPIAEIAGSAKRFEGWPRLSSYDATTAREAKLRTTPYDKSILKRLNDLGYIQ
jgi:arylsulfatase A-like enzyme